MGPLKTIAIATLAATQLLGCGGDSFSFIYVEGGPDAALADDSSSDSPSESEPLDAGSLDALDSALDSDSSADSGVCVQSGSTACTSVIDAYCTRLKACCNGACSYSWANNGGSDCRMYWEGSVGQMDCTKYGNEKVCSEGSCIADMQGASCSVIICNSQMPCSPLPKPMLVSNSCTTFW